MLRRDQWVVLPTLWTGCLYTSKDLVFVYQQVKMDLLSYSCSHEINSCQGCSKQMGLFFLKVMTYSPALPPGTHLSAGFVRWRNILSENHLAKELFLFITWKPQRAMSPSLVVVVEAWWVTPKICFGGCQDRWEHTCTKREWQVLWLTYWGFLGGAGQAPKQAQSWLERGRNGNQLGFYSD